MASSSSSSSAQASETPFSAEKYFATQPPPPTLESDVNAVREFVERHAQQGRKVVLVTSGGTTVPLELNVVRFLDNFSAGTRGATSAEYFLRAGYAVIFMHRQHSLQPFSRHYSHSTNPFLDFLEIEDSESESELESGTKSTSPRDEEGLEQVQKRRRLHHAHSSSKHSNQRIVVRTTDNPDLTHLQSVVSAYKSVKHQGTLHMLTFVTINDYLWLLRAVSKVLSEGVGRKAMYYLAAAVSDFFLPRSRLSEHKIQSGRGSLVLEMDQVPKILKPMVDEWTPEGFIVSFKLETDPSLLISKARTALERYGHQVVIGNELHRRKFEVVFVSKKSGTETEDTTTTSGVYSVPPPNTTLPLLLYQTHSKNVGYE
ncbi:phosphopantothenate-cysteine ligase [Pyrrhoderma noxium]|uniref:Phosphopantothenate-cysteine ligase n=1 Tax=Pyrrhoderma noxium TaxID=2282107 RepID=A0A286U762_9AGAM|nr:phosphopantothenate-cysteine ligase [Pyrrhoderma noxium]